MPVEENDKETTRFRFLVASQMVNSIDTISFGTPSEIISSVTQRTMLMSQKRDALIGQVNLHCLRLIQLESESDIRPRTLEIGRHSAKLDIEVYLESVIMAKATIVCQVMERVQEATKNGRSKRNHGSN